MKKIIENISHQINGKNVLLVGTGGGSDIFSSLLFAMNLFEFAKPKSVDLAGMLSPASIHYYDEKQEQTINELKEKTVVRRTLQDKDQTEIKFVDRKIHDAIDLCKTQMWVNNIDFEIGNVYHFSTLYGSVNLLKDVNKLIERNRYDVVIGVDVGGDILASFNANSVLSPLMDMTCLYVLGNLNVPTHILEFGYGTDGESGNKSMCENMGGMPCCVYVVKDQIEPTFSFDVFIDMYEMVVSPVRSGHTIPLFIKSCFSNEDTITSNHLYTYRLSDFEMKDSFDVVLYHPYNKAYLFDAKAVFEKNKTAIPYGHSMEYALYLKKSNPQWASEIDLQCINFGENTILFGLVSSKFNAEQQEEIFNSILANIGGRYDYALVWRKDIEGFGIDSSAIYCSPVVEEGEEPSDYDVFILYRDVINDKIVIPLIKNIFA